MIIQADSFFKMGSTHKVCEDYAIHGSQKIPFVVVSDGCSSSPHTDVGARIMVFACKKILESMGLAALRTLSYIEIGEKIIAEATVSASHLCVPIEALDATLLVAFVDQEQDLINVLIYGDGSATWCNKKNEIIHLSVEYPSGYPRYLNYLTNSDRYKSFVNISSAGLKQTWGVFNEEIDPINMNIHEPTFAKIPLSDTKWLFLCSDGLETFMDTVSQSSISKKEIIGQISSFKNMNGEFIHRRVTRMMKDLGKNSSTHLDDFSIAGFSFSEGDK